MITSSTRRHENVAVEDPLAPAAGETLLVVRIVAQQKQFDQVKTLSAKCNTIARRGGHRLERHLRIQPKLRPKPLSQRGDRSGSNWTTKSASCVARGIP